MARIVQAVRAGLAGSFQTSQEAAGVNTQSAYHATAVVDGPGGGGGGAPDAISGDVDAAPAPPSTVWPEGDYIFRARIRDQWYSAMPNGYRHLSETDKWFKITVQAQAVGGPFDPTKLGTGTVTATVDGSANGIKVLGVGAKNSVGDVRQGVTTWSQSYDFNFNTILEDSYPSTRAQSQSRNSG